MRKPQRRDVNTHLSKVAQRTKASCWPSSSSGVRERESWCLLETQRQQLRTLHARCARTMCRVTRKHTWTHHIATEDLTRRLGLDSADFYLRGAAAARRQLGHVMARMD